jgi:hypothetical protein
MRKSFRLGCLITGVWTKFGRRPSPRFVQNKYCTEGDGCGQILSKLQLIVLSFVFCAFFAAAECLPVQLKQTTYDLCFQEGNEYNVFSDGENRGTCAFEWLLPEENADREFALTIQSREYPARFRSEEGEVLNCDVFLSFQSLKPLVFYNGENFFQAAIWKQRTQEYREISFPLGISIPSRQKVKPGKFRCTLDLTLYNHAQELIGMKTVNIFVQVVPSQAISFSLEEGGYTKNRHRLDFGEIQEATTRKFYVDVSSNTPYEIQAKSINEGKLQMIPEWQKINYQETRINYSMLFNGKPVNLSNDGNVLLNETQIKDIQGQKFPVTVTIFPDLTKHWEGVYEDEIIFSIRPAY